MVTRREWAQVKRWDVYICEEGQRNRLDHVEDATGQYVTYDDHIKALADAERAGMEQAAKVADRSTAAVIREMAQAGEEA